MPYYVYAIHADRVRLYKACATYDEADKIEREMKKGKGSDKDYSVIMFYAVDDIKAEEIANSTKRS